jgi:hypothetical protein|tara:strand:+ start:578 stop:1063 length:486 start_codon:yes stop_codon:yes gene_type:complete
MISVRKILKEEVENYMFLQNLKTIKTHVDMLLSKSPEELDEILKEHDWASDHISTAKDDVEEVCNFFTNGYVSEGKKMGIIKEAEYQGRKVKLNNPMQGDVKKFKVYVKNDKGNVVKVNFGQKGMVIKKNNPERRKSFRARHNCDNPGPKWKARYWSCKKW